MTFNDKIRGALAGFAFGNALGLGAEFMTRHEVTTYYPEGLRTFGQIIRDAHRSQWERGECTNDAKLVFELLECVLDEGCYNIHAIAHRFKEFVSQAEFDLSPVLREVCFTPGWEEHPVATAHRVWHERNITDATNESVSRALVTAIVSDKRRLMEDTRKISLMTNDDGRCVSTTLILAKMLHTLLHEDREASYEELAEIARTVDPRTSRFLQKAYEGDISSLEIDDEDTQMWTRKAMAASLWGFRHGSDAGDIIYRVIELGGDAATNAALAGAMAGMKYGYKALPEEKKNLMGHARILDVADRLTVLLRAGKEAVQPAEA